MDYLKTIATDSTSLNKDACMDHMDSGKSLAVAGYDGFRHHHGAYASKVIAVKLSLPDLRGSDVVFVDTPESGGNKKLKLSIVRVSHWLHETHKEDINLHDFRLISDDSMAPIPMKNMHLSAKPGDLDEFRIPILSMRLLNELDNKRMHRESDIARESLGSLFLQTCASGSNILSFVNDRAIFILQRDESSLDPALSHARRNETYCPSASETACNRVRPMLTSSTIQTSADSQHGQDNEVDPSAFKSSSKRTMPTYFAMPNSIQSQVDDFERPQTSIMQDSFMGNLYGRDTIRLQQEIGDVWEALRDKSASGTLFKELEHLLSQREGVMGQMREYLKQPCVTEGNFQFLVQEYDKLCGKLKLASEDMKKMGVTTGESFRKICVPFNWKLLDLLMGNVSVSEEELAQTRVTHDEMLFSMSAIAIYEMQSTPVWPDPSPSFAQLGQDEIPGVSAIESLLSLPDNVEMHDIPLPQIEMSESPCHTSSNTMLLVKLENLVSEHQGMVWRMRMELEQTSMDDEQLQFLMQRYSDDLNAASMTVQRTMAPCSTATMVNSPQSKGAETLPLSPAVLTILPSTAEESITHDALILEKEFLALSQTSTDVGLFLELEYLVSREQEILCAIREELKKPQINEERFQFLMQEHHRISTRLKTPTKEMGILKMPFDGSPLEKFTRFRILQNLGRFAGFFRTVKLQSLKAPQATYVDRLVEFLPDDAIILLLGLSGSGKSTFVEECTGLDIGINHCLTGTSSRIKAIRSTFQDRNFILVDTPGFNQTEGLTNKEIALKINWWLKDLGRRSLQLAGVLYLHDIAARLPLRDFILSKGFCGNWESSPEKTVLATTMWTGSATDTDVHGNESLLKETCWRDMVGGGVRVKRHYGGRDSAINILQSVINHGSYL